MINVTSPEAEDMLQEVFLEVIENIEKYASSQKFTTWLYTLTWNRCIDYFRTENHIYHNSLAAGSIVKDLLCKR